MVKKKKDNEQVLTLGVFRQALDSLARSTAKGFADAQKTDDDRFKVVVDEFERIRSDIRDIKGNIGPIMRTVSMQEDDLSDLRLRVNTLERRLPTKS